jgi:ATP-dependent exoDNAse (exonuclease V) beta subunit
MSIRVTTRKPANGADCNPSAAFKNLKIAIDSIWMMTRTARARKMSRALQQVPPDQAARNRSLDPNRSILVQAPAGSGKTDLLTRRFLRLLAEVDEPSQIVAITFTKAAAAEMRHRILKELENAAGGGDLAAAADPFSMEYLARRALDRSRARDWNVIDLSSQLRISTIDSFCRELALQQPLISGVGGNLQIDEQPNELYRRAIRKVMEKLGDTLSADHGAAIEDLLLLRDNGWQEMEQLLISMLGKRDRWMQDFVLQKEKDWEELRERLERPFARAVDSSLLYLEQLFDQVQGASNEAHELARFACVQSGGEHHKDLAELTDFPCSPFRDAGALEEARNAYICFANLLLTNDGCFRQRVDKSDGFPAECKSEKRRVENLIARLAAVPSLETALKDVRALPPARYTEEDWRIVRACFTLLRQAVGELKAVFAETGTIDFIEVAQIAMLMLQGEDGFPSDATRAVAEGIRHLLVDEFQDTSRRQFELINSLINAWPDQSERTLFVVGDPMQSIYFFRDADAELFARVRNRGFESPDSAPLLFDPVSLTANFRSEPTLVEVVNDQFESIFAQGHASGISFARSEPAREPHSDPGLRFHLHLNFIPQSGRGQSADPEAIRAKQAAAEQREAAQEAQVAEVVTLIRSHMDRVEQARAFGNPFRIAVLGRTHTAITPIAQALREAAIPFRALDLEKLKDRPEILDALSLARALFNPHDRVAWLGVLRAPWCGLALEELHAIAQTPKHAPRVVPIPDSLAEKLHLLSDASLQSAERILNVVASVSQLGIRTPTASLGTLLQQVWLSLGGDHCVDATARANLDLFWRLLDKLPQGEVDLLGPALDTALERLCALPDPAASSECGVQLMTIHKSKGLEFEIVIVPELQAPARNSEKRLLSWLERGLEDSDQPGDITEFLIAPIQSKGAEGGDAKKWVDRAYRERESQETRRILYVAATRAREELHLFARPSYKEDKDGALLLAEPFNCLLATAWPALEETVRIRFNDWQTSRTRVPEEKQTILSLAASGQDNLVLMPSPSKITQLRCLPSDFQITPTIDLSHSQSRGETLVEGRANPYERHEGDLISRSLGSAVHRLLEEVARLRLAHDWPSAITGLDQFRSRIVAQIRSAGMSPAQAASIAAQAYEFVLKATGDPHGQWILSPHVDAASEAGWAGIVAENLRRVRVDRLFRAGPEPFTEGEDCWWIIDFKTAHDDDLHPAAKLPEFRRAFAPQLEMYATLLRNLHGADARLRAALYYPRMSLFDWWEI